MVPNAMKRVYLAFALLLGLWSTNAKGGCLNKDGVSVDLSDGPVISWQTEFRQASVVLIGTVVSQKNIHDPKQPDFYWTGTFYRLVVQALLKGKAGASVQVFTPNDSGRLPFMNGARYLLFLHSEDGRLTTDSCGNSAKLVYP